MIKNIIFDMGNVLIDFNPMQYVGKLNLKDKEEEVKVFKAAYVNYKSIYMDYGKITEEEFVDHVVKGIGEEYRDKVAEVILHWDQYLTPIRGMEELIKELKDKGYKIYLLSNAGFNQHDYWEKIPAHKYFDGAVVSCDAQVRALADTQAAGIDELEHCPVAETQVRRRIYDIQDLLDRIVIYRGG